MTPAAPAYPAPAVIRIGQARVTAGLDRYARLDLAAHRSVFGPAPDLTAGQLVAMCEEVDLRGRGGAAFPAAKKLRAVLANISAKRRPVVVVNGTEGEPGSFKDKILLSRSPYLVLDGAVLAARALQATEVIIAVTSDGLQAQSVADAVAASAVLSQLVRVVLVPDRFVTGESGSLINALNGKPALPAGVKTRASDSGVGGMPTYLSNAETFAQLAVLAMLGPAGYASVGSQDEPGTVLLTVGGSVSRPTVVETPTDVPLGHILDICGARPPLGVLVGGYHGMWISPEIAYDLPVSRAGLAHGGGTLGAGIVLVLGEESCPLGEVSRVTSYMAMQSSGQCGPCKLGLPSVARSLAAITAGAGGVDELDALRRATAAVRGRGACHHPDGTANFVASALDVFARDLSEHMFRGNCGRPTSGIMPLPDGFGDTRLTVDWTRCEGHGLCARLAPELIQLDADGYPEFLDVTVPFWLAKDARQAVDMCPALALTLATPGARPRPAVRTPQRAPAIGSAPPPAATAPQPRIQIQPPPPAQPQPQPQRPRPLPQRLEADPPTLTGRAMRKAELAAASAWLAELGGNGGSGY